MYAALKKYGPNERNEFSLEMKPGEIKTEKLGSGIYLDKVLNFLEIPDSLNFSVLVNGSYSDRTRPLKNGDTLIIFPLLDGG